MDTEFPLLFVCGGLLLALVAVNVVLYRTWKFHEKHPTTFYKKMPWWTLCMGLLWTAPVQAAPFVIATETHVVETGQSVEGCTLCTTYDEIHTHYGTNNGSIFTNDSNAQTYKGGQPGRFVHCPDDCDDTIIIGTPAMTRVEDVTTTFTTETHQTFTIVSEFCDTPTTVTPESGTMGMFLVGIALIVISKIVVRC